jgi:hypothetical protein
MLALGGSTSTTTMGVSKNTRAWDLARFHA